MIQMKRGSIKQSFGGETAFTKHIAATPSVQERLLEALNLAVEDGYTVKPENPTEDSKRVDLTIQDSEGTILLVIESQDATGWLDSIHASKIMYYMWDKNCDQGVLLTEDADERIMSFVRKLNTDHNWSITLLKTLIYELDAGDKYVDFVPLIRGSDIEYESPGVRVKSDLDPQRAQLLKGLADRYAQSFTNITTTYCSHNELGVGSMNVGIKPYKNGKFWIGVYHAGKHNTDTFRETFTSFVEQNWPHLQPKFQQVRGYVNGDSGLEEAAAMKVFDSFVTALKSNQIKPS